MSLGRHIKKRLLDALFFDAIRISQIQKKFVKRQSNGRCLWVCLYSWCTFSL